MAKVKDIATKIVMIREVRNKMARHKTNLTCFDVANYFLSLVDEDTGDSISNLKLQKLVYYAQGFHLAIFDAPLFSEGIEAWILGPVIPKLYDKYKVYGSGPIPKPEDIDFSVYESTEVEFLNDVWNGYGQYSAWRLSELTHAEPPWKMGCETGKIITHQSLRTYFKTQIQES